MKTKQSNTMTLGQFKDKYYGKVGSKERDELEVGYENFKNWLSYSRSKVVRTICKYRSN
jgi:hypothetical protein